MIIYRGKNLKVIKAVKIANQLLNNNHGFIDSIKKRRSFEMATCTPNFIASSMSLIHMVDAIHYEEYRPWWPWSKAIGYFDKKKPLSIFVNKYKLRKMSVSQIVGNIIHEFVHLTDHQCEDEYFGHGSNSNPNGTKNNTAPYWIGYFARSVAKDKYGVY